MKPPVTRDQIEREVYALRTRLDAAAETLTAYEADLAPVRERYAPRIRRHAAEVRTARERLLKLLTRAPRDLWGKVKSRVIHGLTVGWRKGADKWAWPDEDALVALIRERCTPEQVAAYLTTTTRGRKDAIPDPVRAEVLGIGCTRGEDASFVSESAPGTAEALFALLAVVDPPAAPAAPKASRGSRRTPEAA